MRSAVDGAMTGTMTTLVFRNQTSLEMHFFLSRKLTALELALDCAIYPVLPRSVHTIAR